MIYVVKEGQTVLDLSVQLYGDLSHVIDLIKDNSDIIDSVDTPLISGSSINYTDQNTPITNSFRGINISTNYPQITSIGSFSDGFDNGYEN